MEVCCGPCNYRGVHRKAEKYCLSCQELQCITCADIHRSSKATRNHLQLATTDFKDASDTTNDIEKFQNCTDHPEKKLEFYCLDHEHFLCSACLLNVRKFDCKTVVDIETAGEQLVTETYNEQIVKDLESIVDLCKAKENKISRLIDKSQAKRQGIQKYIEGLKQKIIEHINKCEINILRTVDENAKVMVTNLTSQKTVLSETRTRATQNKELLKAVVNDNLKADIFRCTLSITQQLNEYQEKKDATEIDIISHSVKLSPAFDSLIATMESIPMMQCNTNIDFKMSLSSVTLKTNNRNMLRIAKQVAPKRGAEISQDYTCSSADADAEDFETKKDLADDRSGKGSANTSGQNTKAENLSVTSTNEMCDVFQDQQHVRCIDVTAPDGKKLFVFSMVTLLDGCIVLADERLPRLIRLNKDLTYKDTAELTPSHPPGNMTVLNEKFLVVCLPTANRVAFVSVTPDFVWMRNFKTTHSPKGIFALDYNLLLVSMKSYLDQTWCLKIITTDGALLQDIGKTRSILDASQISSVIINPGSSRCYLQCCKMSNALYCFDVNGKELFQYSVSSPKCLYVDKAAKIYVLDSSGCVHILASNGVLLRKMAVSAEANGITCSKNGDTLIVTKQQSSVISVYNVT